jgi:hypothetical protein
MYIYIFVVLLKCKYHCVSLINFVYVLMNSKQCELYCHTLNKTKSNLILQTITTITAIKTIPATVRPQIRPTQNINN